MSLVVLIRHFRTQDDLEQKYTSNESPVSILPADGRIVATMRKELTLFNKIHNVSRILYSANLRGRQTAELLFRGTPLYELCEPESALNNIAQPAWAGL